MGRFRKTSRLYHKKVVLNKITRINKPLTGMCHRGTIHINNRKQIGDFQNEKYSKHIIQQ
jgi:hypothetical protein